MKSFFLVSAFIISLPVFSNIGDGPGNCLIEGKRSSQDVALEWDARNNTLISDNGISYKVLKRTSENAKSIYTGFADLMFTGSGHQTFEIALTESNQDEVAEGTITFRSFNSHDALNGGNGETEETRNIICNL